MAAYEPSSFFLRIRLCHQKRQKEQGQYSAILTEQAWSIKVLLYGQRENFYLRD